MLYGDTIYRYVETQQNISWHAALGVVDVLLQYVYNTRDPAGHVSTNLRFGAAVEKAVVISRMLLLTNPPFSLPLKSQQHSGLTGQLYNHYKTITIQCSTNRLLCHSIFIHSLCEHSVAAFTFLTTMMMMMIRRKNRSIMSKALFFLTVMIRSPSSTGRG